MGAPLIVEGMAHAAIGPGTNILTRLAAELHDSLRRHRVVEADSTPVLAPTSDTTPVKCSVAPRTKEHTPSPEAKRRTGATLMTPLARVACPALLAFQREYMLPAHPVILTDCIGDWPALTRWSDPAYIQVRGAGGRGGGLRQ